MPASQKYISLRAAILCSLALMVFSFFIQYKLPFRLISFTVLFIPAFFFSRTIRSFSDLRSIVIGSAPARIIVFYSIAGLLLGLVFSILYRWHLEIRLLPDSFHFFVFTAALIGATEELVFRGIIQEYAKSVNGLFSVLFSTLSHTAYKCFLFLSPAVSTGMNIGFLALWTFIGGMIFGSIRHLSKSLVPALIAHVLFDILVYAEFADAPWWVW
jgi:membrane protease YdiL (CAAX protease family)